ncbi:MAG: FtsX-like permease family protein [Bacteroidia bacterium]|nr:FtsX-like permease family protein [Bacteroidia bacterium]NNJ55798.1 FtsX-like permease family protein [Bacteroidia bacterium]
MIKFLLKGIIRDKSRSILPIIITAIGVTLTVFLSGYMRGAMGDMIDLNARFETGHIKVMTQPYLKNKDQLPNDLALLEVSELIADLEKDFPEISWEKRIRFGGLVDAPDENGLTQGQGPAAGLAIDLFSKHSNEIGRMNLAPAIVNGTIPIRPGEALISEDFSQKINASVGDDVTFVGSTMNGSMAFQNFKVAGTVRFGSAAMDKGAIIIDITDAQNMLDMEDGAGEILGYFPNDVYDNNDATQIAETFNAKYIDSDDEFAPIMQSLKQQNGLASLLDYADVMSGMFVAIFVFAMSIVLWNTGLLGGLRRYQEYGIRLALGESKGHIYRMMISEAVLIGILGSILGSILGLAAAYALQVYGFDISEFAPQSNMLMPNVIRAKVTPDLFYIGFIPGVFAMVLGTALSGIGIYKRETATLFKELEV